MQAINRNIANLLFFGSTLFFVLLNLYFIYGEIPYLSVLPIVLLIVLIGLFDVRPIFFLVVLLTPLSINLAEFDLPVGMYLPTEPLLFGVMLLFVFKLFVDKNYFDFQIIKHPLSLIVLMHLAWIFVTSITSQDVLVSFKFLLARMWFVLPCFYFAIFLFRDKQNIRRFIWLYIFSLTLVIVYTVINHAMHGFEEKPAHWVMSPFFKDHTSYGALVAMYYPALFGFYFNRETPPLAKTPLIALIIIFTLGLIFSYTRAAWLSVLGALAVFAILRFRIRLSTVITLVAATGFVFFAFFDQIVLELERNKTDSSDNFTDHIQSVSNISSDASNLERINRWNCALRMWNEHEFFGWGPGTYQFYYAPFQHSSELTIISTNFGDGGNAHSEYLGPLAEQGILGMLIMITLVIATCYYAIRVYYKLDYGEIRLFVLVTFLGLVTYYIHGILNNYLDTDKASVPFWGFTAVIVAVDLYHTKKKSVETNR